MAVIYQFRLKGHLDNRHAQRFNGLKMTLHPNGETILTGPIVDQSALLGVLINIVALGIPLLSVHSIDSASANEPKNL